MAKQLIVAFAVLVVLTQQSFSRPDSSDKKFGQNDVQDQNQYTTSYQQQEASQYSGQSQYQQQYGVVGEQSNTNNQGQSTANNQEQSITNNQEQSITNNQDQSNAYGQNQNKDRTTDEEKGNSQQVDKIHSSGWGYGEEEESGVQKESNAHDQDQKKDTTTGGGKGESPYPYETQLSGSSYGQGQDQQDDAVYQSNGEVLAQESESETSLKVGNASVLANRENLLILHSDGKNVTLEFGSVESALAILNDVTLAQHTKAKTSDSAFQWIVYLLKNSGSNGSHHVISSSQKRS